MLFRQKSGAASRMQYKCYYGRGIFGTMNNRIKTDNSSIGELFFYEEKNGIDPFHGGSDT